MCPSSQPQTLCVPYSTLSQPTPSFQPASTVLSLTPPPGQTSSRSRHLGFHWCPQELGPSQPTFTSRHQKPVGHKWPLLHLPQGQEGKSAEQGEKRAEFWFCWPGASYLASTVTYDVHCNMYGVKTEFLKLWFPCH